MVTELTDAQRKHFQLRYLKDPVAFCREILTDKFPLPMPWVHRGILAILLRRTDFLTQYGELDVIVEEFVDEAGRPLFRWNDFGGLDLVINRNTVLMLPRGYSKTTIVNAANLIKILYFFKKFILYVGETQGHANAQVGTIRRELETNQKILAIYGNLQPEKNSGKKWNDEQLETVTGVVIMAKGSGGQVRGTNHNGQRPDSIVFDDLEDSESVSTPEQRKKKREWFYQDLKPCLPRMDPNAELVGLGTLLHPEALLMVLMEDPEFTRVRFGAVTPKGRLLWPESMDEKKIELQKLSFTRVGNLAGFYREYMSQVRDDSSAKFKQEYVKHRAVDRGELVCVAMVIDPAISEAKGADGSSIAVVGMAQRGHIYVLEVWWEVGATPRRQVDKYFELSEKWQVDQHGVETIAYQAALVHILKEEMFRRGVYFDIAKITHTAHKDERILGVLQPRYAAGYISHARPFPEYESQLLNYPNAKKDAPDAVAMAITLLDPYAAAAAGDKDLGEDEYEELDYSKVQVI